MSKARASLLATSFGLILCTTAASSSALDQVTSGYSAFRPWPSSSSQSCISEYWGGAINTTCQYGVSTVLFELPISANGGSYQVSATAFSRYGATAAFSCQAIALSPNSLSGVWGTNASFTLATQTASAFVNVPSGWSLRLVCDSFPFMRGLESVRWGLNEL